MSNAPPAWPPRKLLRVMLVCGLIALACGVGMFSVSLSDTEFPFGALFITSLGLMAAFGGWVGLCPHHRWLARAVLFGTPLIVFLVKAGVEADRGRTRDAVEAVFAAVVLGIMWFVQVRRSRSQGPAAA
jgi:hypothetical protein